MFDTSISDAATVVLRQAEELERDGALRAAIDLLTDANREDPDGAIERALVHLRREGGRTTATDGPSRHDRVTASPDGGTLVEVAAADLDLGTLRRALAACGCLLVRGLVPKDTANRLAAGMDAALDAYDASQEGDREWDAAWYDPRSMPDRSASALPEAAHRAFLRGRGAMWTADSPRMLFELFELVDDLGLGRLMTDYLGERPLLSGIKGTMRRVPPDVEVDGRWHQDGAFLGEDVSALNIWITLSSCGVDAPGLDIVPRRMDHVVRDDDARFDWSLSDAAVTREAADTPVVRPQFEVGDALLFDHLLIHRTGASPSMTRSRHAIESWFFGPSAYPADQLPVLY